MSKRKPIDKTQARERRNRLLESAASAELSLTEGVREMRAIAGMTQEEFAQHRGVSARVIKAIELGQGNPTVATLNRIGEFFGLEVAFVPVRRKVLKDAGTLGSDAQRSEEAERTDPDATINRTPWEDEIKRRFQEAFELAFDDARARLKLDLPQIDVTKAEVKLAAPKRKSRKPSPR